MTRKLREDTLLIELVAEGAIAAEAGDGILAGLLVDVVSMGELEQERPLATVAGKGLQISLAARGGGGVADAANGRPGLGVVIIEVVGMAGHALIVAGPS